MCRCLFTRESICGVKNLADASPAVQELLMSSASPPSIDELAPSVFLSKAVRDLHWVLASPHLLTPLAGVPCCDDAWCAQIVAQSLPWLRTLDAEPKPLEQWLRLQHNVRRLGFYYAALLEYWVRYCPVLSLGGPVLVGEQIHAGIDGPVAGQLKLVFKRRAISIPSHDECVHWESHVKFFAWCPPTGDHTTHASASVALPPVAEVDETSRIEAGLAQYVGPFLGENLLHRVVELRRKVNISGGPNVQAFIRSKFEDANEEGGSGSPPIRAESVVRGWFFYPLEPVGEVKAATTPPEGVSATHGRGWWSRSLDDVLQRHQADSRWALPGSGAGVRGDAKGALGGKLHWMAPAVARVEGSSPLAIQGIPSIGCEACPLLTADELRDAIVSTQRLGEAHTNPKQQPRWPSGVGSAPTADFPAAMLIIQLRPLHHTHAGASSSAALDGIWTEASRGFLMPHDWDPTPLCRAIPLGLRSGMRQKQRTASSDSEYREAERVSSVEPQMLSVRLGSSNGFGPKKASNGDTDADEASKGAADVSCMEPDKGAVFASPEEMWIHATIAHLRSAWKKLVPVYEAELQHVCASFLAACTVNGEQAACDTDRVEEFETAVTALVSAKPSSTKASGKEKGHNSRFALAKAAVARLMFVAHEDRPSEANLVQQAVAMLRHVLKRPGGSPRLLSTLLVAAIATSEAVKPYTEAATLCERLVSDALTTTEGWPVSLVVEMVQSFGVHVTDGESPGATSSWPPVVTRHAAVEYVDRLLEGEASGSTIENLTHATSLVRTIGIIRNVDANTLVHKLAAANMWQVAEQLASASCSEPELDTSEASSKAYVAVQKAAKVATVATVEEAAEGADSVQRVADALGGYIKPRGRGDYDNEFSIGRHPWGGRLEGLSSTSDHKRGGDGGQLLQLVLSLAHQRQNQKVVSKLEPLVRELCGGGPSTAVQNERTAMVARLVNSDQLAVAASFVGVDTTLQAKLVFLAAEAGHHDQSKQLAQQFGVRGSALAGEDQVLSGSAPHDARRLRGEALPPYKLPKATRIDVYEDPALLVEANRTLLGMLHAARGSSNANAVLGLDAEWVAGQPISLLQLAVPGWCVLLRLRRLATGGDAWPPLALVEMLADRTLLKLGVGIGNDLRMLREQYGLESAGVVELQALASREGFHAAGLQRLTGEIIGLHLDKQHGIRCGNWEAPILSDEQTCYAAKDAHVALDLFERLHKCHLASMVEASVASSSSDHAWCSAFIDVPESKRAGKRQQSQALQQSKSREPTSEVPEKAFAEAEDAFQSASVDSSPALGSADIANCIRRLQIDENRARLVNPDDVDRAAYLDIKSLAVWAKGAPVVVVLPTDKKLDPCKVALHLQLSLTSRRAMSRQVRLATPDECVTFFGYRPGTVPPLGHREPDMPILLDSKCATSSVPLLAGGGDYGTQLVIEPAVLAGLHTCRVGDVALTSSEAVVDGLELSASAANVDKPADAANGDPGPRALQADLGRDLEVCEVNPWLVPRLVGDANGEKAPALNTAEELYPPGQSVQRAAVEPKFLVDAMMGRLLRWLRVLGVDSLLREEGEGVAQVFARARNEGRIILTRDRKIAERRDGGAVAVFVVSSDESRAQLREIVSHFGLRLSATEFMMRCSVCNGRGYIKLSREDVAARNDCPPKVLEQVEEFYSCRSCGKLYWEGPKSNNAFEHFTSVFDAMGATKGDAYVTRNERYGSAPDS